MKPVAIATYKSRIIVIYMTHHPMLIITVLSLSVKIYFSYFLLPSSHSSNPFLISRFSGFPHRLISPFYGATRNELETGVLSDHHHHHTSLRFTSFKRSRQKRNALYLCLFLITCFLCGNFYTVIRSRHYRDFIVL